MTHVVADTTIASNSRRTVRALIHGGNIVAVEDAFAKVFEKLIDLAKSGWQIGVIACAIGVVWLLMRLGFLPTPAPYWPPLLALGFFGGIFLAFAPAGPPLVEWVRKSVVQRSEKRRLKEKFAKEIEFLTPMERQIIGYLLEKRQKVFQTDLNGGNAATLLGRGYIRVLAQRGQQIDLEGGRVPMVVDEIAWEVWDRNKDKFPYKPKFDQNQELVPWSIHWMAR